MAEENNAQVEKKSTFGDIMGEYVSTNVKETGYNVLIDVVIPGTIDVIHQALVAIVDNTLHPYTSRNKNGTSSSVNRSSSAADRYHRSYKREYEKQQQTTQSNQTEQDRIELAYNWRFDDEGQAQITLEYLRDCIDKTRSAAVAQFFDSPGVREVPKAADWEWGWTDLSERNGVRVIAIRSFGRVQYYQIRLPKVEKIQ